MIWDIVKSTLKKYLMGNDTSNPVSGIGVAILQKIHVKNVTNKLV
jgi:hypothetical protein